jgi:hypothetical protein
MRKPTARWPGVEQVVGCTYTCGHGAAPGVASLTIRDQDVRRVRPFGNLVIEDGVNKPLILKRCRVLDARYSSGATGPRTVTLQIADRRWMWAFGHITGSYNVIDRNIDLSAVAPGEYTVAGGPFANGTYRPAVLLVRDCLRAMGENTALIAEVPGAAPPVNWEFANPANELESVCGPLGLRLCYQPTLDGAAVVQLGVGGKLPDLPSPSIGGGFDVPGRPSAIEFFGGPTQFNDILMLEPVGLEADGEIRPIEQLTFKPANGWERDNPHFWQNVRATARLTKPEAIRLAQQHVYRTFRVKMVDAQTGKVPGPTVPGYGRVNEREQIVLLPEQYQDVNARGSRYSLPPDVFGSINVSASPDLIASGTALTNGNTGEDTPLKLRPQIDTEHGLVTFDRLMYRRVDRANAAPVLRLRTSFQIRSVVGRQFNRLFLSAALPGVGFATGCPSEAVYRPDLIYMIETSRRPSTWAIQRVRNNGADVLPAANYYLNAAVAKYDPKVRYDREYAGVVPISPDGLIHQVTWTVGNGAPATTRVSVNGEHATYLPSYPEKRRVRDLTRALSAKEQRDAEANNARTQPAVSQNPKPAGEI